MPEERERLTSDATLRSGIVIVTSQSRSFHANGYYYSA